MILQIGVAVVVACLALVAEHYFPWHSVLNGKPLGRVSAYVLGCLALFLPLSALLVLWQMWPALVALWAITVAGGGTVILCYALDNHYRLSDAGERERQLIDTMRRGGDEPN